MDLLYSPLTPPVACCSSSKHISHAFCPLAHIGTQSPRCVPVGRLPRQANEECFFCLAFLPSSLITVAAAAAPAARCASHGEGAKITPRIKIPFLNS